jgi:hypothetical protein
MSYVNDEPSFVFAAPVHATQSGSRLMVAP